MLTLKNDGVLPIVSCHLITIDLKFSGSDYHPKDGMIRYRSSCFSSTSKTDIVLIKCFQ